MFKPDNVIKRFYITGGEGLSEYWRRNKSPIESRELAHLLQAIRKITGYIGPNAGNVIWAGMRSSTEATDITLNPALVMGKYPIPGNKTDMVIGTVIIEALKRIEWSERVIKLIYGKLGKPTQDANVKLKMFLEMAEQIFVDIVANRTVLGLYTEKVREIKFSEARKDFVQPPSFEELIHIWWLMAADKSGCKYQEEFTNQIHGSYGYNLENFYKKPLRVLNSIVREMKEECRKLRGVVERCEYRAKLYTRIWNEIEEMTKFWLTDLNDPSLMPKALDFDDVLSGDLGEALKAIQATLAKEIEAKLTRNNFDLTDEVRIICQDDGNVVPIEVSNFVVPLEEPINKELAYKLYLALKGHAKRRNLFNRGLNSGKIDGRRLFRAPINGKIFYYKKEKHVIDSDLIILVDATGSMGGPKWKDLQIIFSALFEAVKSFDNTIRVFAYYEVKGKTNLTELSTKKGELFTVLPRGKTASGEAIIATTLMLKKKTKQPFFIHFTDGASNWGCEVKYAIKHCKKNKINLMTLGFGCQPSSKAALREEYGNQVEFVDTLQELPKKFSKLLKHTNYI